ncbi:MAG: NADH-quinone oxidoreductase subunit L [Actinomycetota bacterium]
MLDLIWLVPALPLAGAVINLFFGKRLGKWAGWLGSAVVVASLVISVGLLVGLLALGPDGESIQHIYKWLGAGEIVSNGGRGISVPFEVSLNLLLDQLSATMILVVTGVGALIHVYSIGYMRDDPRIGRFFAYMNLFVFFMLLLVLADNFLILFVGWEGVGLCSYLLIGFWFEKPAAASAAKKAFVVTRIGDTAMLIGIVWLAVHFATLGFDKTLNFCTPDRAVNMECLAVGPTHAVQTAIALLLLAGAIGKSAQIPLHVWLPDAMEGPSPVSALIHAATMVTAGVYLVVRAHVLFTPEALTVVLIIGLATAFYAATAALGQDDIKRVLAYSTISQLGYMFFAAGLGAYSLAIVLLVVHAFYKGLMFLAAGSVMHGLGGEETDMKKMGGLAKTMPFTATVFIIGALALSGLPPLSGFFSKDPILAFAAESGFEIAWIVSLAAAFLSALYIARLIFLTFFGKYRGDAHPHEAPRVMRIPMAILAAAAFFGGLLTLTVSSGIIEDFLEPVLGEIPERTQGLPDSVLTVISIAVAAAGVLLGYFIWGSGKVDWQKLRTRVMGLHRFLERGWYVDDAYAHLLVPAGYATAGFLATSVDQRVIDGSVNGLGRVFALAASAGRQIQSGLVRRYALAFLLGVATVLLYLAVRY